MIQLRNIKTSWKITILILFMAFFLALVGYVGHYAAETLADKMDDMYKNRLQPIQWLNASRAESRGNEALTLALFLSKDPSQRQTIFQTIEEHKKIYIGHLEKYQKTNLDAFEQKTMNNIMEETKLYRIEWNKALDLAMSGKQEEGYTYFSQNAASHLTTINKLLDDLAEYHNKIAEEEKRKSEEIAVYNDQISMGITVIAIILSSILGWSIARLIIRPLKDLLTEVHLLAAGELRNRKVHEVYYQDEIGQLTKDFDHMANQLHGLVKNISEASNQLALSSKDLHDGAEEAAKVTEQVTVAIEDVAKGAQSQSGMIDETATSVEHMAAAIAHISENSNTVAEAVSKTVNAAVAGAKSAESVAMQMNSIEETVESSAQAVKKLGDRSQEIGKIIDTISGIASQTNLLALNAAIEAARAGENGKGFAVVAEEVRKLAEQSKEAAAQIGMMISDVQSETDKAVTAMNRGSQEVKLGAQVVESAGENFREITSLVNDVASQSMEISSSIEEMSASSEQIAIAVKNIDQVGKMAVGKTQTVSAATEEHSASVEEILAASQSLANTAKALHDAVAFFKV
ncbi:methyl-accepting chemotaxis protein [Anaerosinus massiliensis]|uniref:methyl-accepting chemotaxis protein n=1 Tax=Massilibacillus massiliensis TaxID=1806837 RepID=UPI000A6E4914|nr:methyl-accepting chemotaxis protein [Massilibacillus massiliensis]